MFSLSFVEKVGGTLQPGSWQTFPLLPSVSVSMCLGGFTLFLSLLFILP